LSRRFVARNQRERILAAVAQATVDNGYGGMSVQDVVRQAGVSRRTFYELYSNKDDAFMAAYHEGATRLLTSVRAAYRTETSFEGMLSAMLSEFLNILAASPTFAHMCIVDVMAAGPEAIAKRTWVMTEFAKLIDENARRLVGRDVPPPVVAEILVGGIYEAIYRRIARGELDQLPALLPDVVQSALLPYIGNEAATAYRRELEAAIAARPPVAAA